MCSIGQFDEDDANILDHGHHHLTKIFSLGFLGATEVNFFKFTDPTVTDSAANTDFPVVFHDESNGLLDDTGALTYNPSTGALVSSGTITASQTLAATVDTSIDASEFATFAGKKIVYTGGAGTLILADAVSGDVGKSWTLLNSGTGALTVDRTTNTQTIKHLNGSAVSSGTSNLTVATGAVTEIICTAVDNYIIFGSGIS